MDSNRFEKMAKLRYNTLGVIPQVKILPRGYLTKKYTYIV